MKKYMLLFMAIFTFFMAGCSAPEGDGADSGSVRDDGQAEKAREHLMRVWSDYLRVQEELYASELWALDYVETYLDTGDWDDLVKARTACIASVQFIAELSMSEEDLSDEEYVVLAENGADTAFLSVEFESVPSGIEEEHMFMRNRMLESVEAGVFLASDMEFLREAVSLHKEYIGDLCQCEGITTNYLLLSLGEEQEGNGYWKAFREDYPTLFRGTEDWNDSETELQKNMDQYLDGIEEITLRQADLLSAMEADLYKMREAVENQEADKWRESAFEIKNTPELLPMPAWYQPDGAKYLSFIAGEDGDVSYPESGEELTDDSYGVYVQMEGISAEETGNYVEGIKGFAKGIQKEEGSDIWFVMMEGYDIKIRVEEGTVTLLFDGEDVTFAPGWYLGL